MAHFKITTEDGEQGLCGFVLVADNGEPVANSTERYRDETDAKRGAHDAVHAALSSIDALSSIEGGSPLAKMFSDDTPIRFEVEEESG